MRSQIKTHQVNTQAQVKGQAMIELVVAITTVLILFVVFLPLLGKFAETKQATDQAARYMAWERTVWFEGAPSGTSNAAVKSNVELEREIHWRFFSDSSVELSSEDALDSKSWKVANNINPMLATRQGDGDGLDALLIESNTSNNSKNATTGNNNGRDDKLIRATVVEQETPGMLPIVGAELDLIGAIGGFRVNERGFFGGQVTYQYADISGIDLFDSGSTVNSTSQLYVLGDGWNTSGRNHTVGMVKNLTPSAIIGEFGLLNDVRDGLSGLVDVDFDIGIISVEINSFAKEIGTDWLDFGRVDTEQIPLQRLCEIDRNEECNDN